MLDMKLLEDTIEFKDAKCYKFKCTGQVIIGNESYNLTGLGDTKLEAQRNFFSNATEIQFALMKNDEVKRKTYAIINNVG